MTRKHFKVIASIIAIMEKAGEQNVNAEDLKKVIDGELKRQNPNYESSIFWSEVEKVKAEL